MTELIGETRIVACADGRRSGKLSKRRRQAMDSAAFLIDGDERRLWRRALPKTTTQGQDLARLATIKMKYDSMNLFRMNQNIAPASVT